MQSKTLHDVFLIYKYTADLGDNEKKKKKQKIAIFKN